MPLRCVAAVLVIAIVLVGCTAREGRREHEERLAIAVAARTEALETISTARVDDVESFEKAATKTRAAADQLTDVGAPRDVEEAASAASEALEELSALLSQFADCARLGKTRRTAAAECRRRIPDERIDTIENAFSRSDTIYRRKGYDVPHE